jgi:lipopolysaccharide transport system ATP-binding protein
MAAFCATSTETAGASEMSVLQTSAVGYARLALSIHDLGKCYRRYARQWDRVRQWFAGKQKRYYQEHWALRQVSFQIERGQTVGILGANGSGKSTLLQLIAGTLAPTEGSIAVNGRVAALLELGSGFHPEFTGWENARLQASILGVSPEEVEEKLPSMAAFSELGEALDQPLRTYSSGMIVRLGFSVAISVQPDILLIDEALAVGDMRFQQKCMTRIRQLRERGVTILLVTHDLTAIKRLCDHAHVLECGALVQSGPSEPVCNWYFGHMMSDSSERAKLQADVPFRHGEGGARIKSWTLVDENQHSCTKVWLGRAYTLQVTLAYTRHIDQPVLGFYLRDRLGTEVLGTNTDAAGMPLPPGHSGRQWHVSFRFVLRLRPGAYTLCVAIVNDPVRAQCLDWIDNALILEVMDPQPGRVIHGLLAEEIAVTIKSPADVTAAAA